VAFQKKNEAWTYLTKKQLQNPLLTPALVRRIVKFHLAFVGGAHIEYGPTPLEEAQ
jgi:hypothetical protein